MAGDERAENKVADRMPALLQVVERSADQEIGVPRIDLTGSVF
jgi:hypothetical protein